jgi:hypothetical protein
MGVDARCRVTGRPRRTCRLVRSCPGSLATSYERCQGVFMGVGANVLLRAGLLRAGRDNPQQGSNTVELRTRIVGAGTAIVIAGGIRAYSGSHRGQRRPACPVCGFSRAVSGPPDTCDRNPAQRNGLHWHLEQALVLGGQRRVAAVRNHHREGTACRRLADRPGQSQDTRGSSAPPTHGGALPTQVRRWRSRSMPNCSKGRSGGRPSACSATRLHERQV